MKTLSFNEYISQTEATWKVINDILQEKLNQGINGLEWLVMQVEVNERRRESLSQFTKFAERICKRDINQLFTHAITMDSDNFYKNHELNWWITVDEALTFLRILKERDYYTYLDYINQIYR